MEVQQHYTLSGNNEAEPDGVSCKKSNTVQIYFDDAVKHKNSGMIGSVAEVYGDPDLDSDSEVSDDEDEEGDESNNGGRNSERNDAFVHCETVSLQTNELSVLWMDESSTIENFSDVQVINRRFLPKNFVATAADPTGQVGVVVDVNISVDLLAHDGSIVREVSSKALKRIGDFTRGDYVLLGSWLGRIKDVLDNVTVLCDDGSVSKHKSISKNFVKDRYPHFPYYTGQRVRVAKRLEGTVTNVTVGSVLVCWITSAGYGPYSSTPPAEEQTPKNLKLLSCFAHANWDLGDWCLLPQENKDPVDEARPLHSNKEESYERAFVISNIRSRVDVAWQDGTIERELDSTSLILIHNLGDHEFLSEQYVVEKTSDDVVEDNCETSRVGVVRSFNAKERTACVRWIKPADREDDPREFDKEEIVSVYELGGHPDYYYCYGDVVVRLSPVTSVCSEALVGESVETSKQENEESGPKKESENASAGETDVEFSDLSWVGNITGLKNGDIEVTWADGMVSTVGPQEIYVVYEPVGAGSDTSDVSSSETVNDDEMEVLEDAKEDATSEAEENGEKDFGRTTTLCVPLAAIHQLVTRLASGIFSRGQKNLDPVHTLSNDEIVCPSKVNVCESNSQECIAIDGDNSGNKSCKNEEAIIPEGSEDVELAETLCSLKNGDAPASCDNDACSLKHFDLVTDHPSDHYYIDANGQTNNGKWFKKVQQDWGILQNNLPEEIFVRVYEDRMELVRAVIVGPFGTPYQDGLFFFDFHLPPEYPDVPPSAYYHSGGWRINPNLYEEGKVCLSLLNTWTGIGNEVWDPKSSSILQVLVSLQGLVLNSKPYFNEAGYDKQIGTTEGEKNSLSYNENTFLLNCKTMMYLMRNPPKDFEVLIKEHFKRRGHYILKACDAYMKGYLIGSLNSDASVSHNSSPNSNSVGFKLMLAKIVPKLFLSLSEVGADCEQFKHLKEL